MDAIFCLFFLLFVFHSLFKIDLDKIWETTNQLNLALLDAFLNCVKIFIGCLKRLMGLYRVYKMTAGSRFRMLWHTKCNLHGYNVSLFSNLWKFVLCWTFKNHENWFSSYNMNVSWQVFIFIDQNVIGDFD